MKIEAAQRLLATPKDTSRNFSFVPNLVSATMELVGADVRIVVKTSKKPPKPIQLRISRTVFIAAEASSRRVRELGSTEHDGVWISEYILRSE